MMKSSFRVLRHAGSFRRYLVFLILVPLGYLLQISAMPYFHTLFGVTPNLMCIVIGIVTVAYGRLQAFWTGLLYGLLLEIMLPSFQYLNLGVYTLSSLFMSFIFSDRSLQQVEMDRALNRKSREMPAWLRTLLCAMSNVTLYEVINIAYIYLGGSPLTVGHFLRGVEDVLLTGLLALPLLFLIRRMIFGPKKETRVLKNAPLIFGNK